MITDRSTLIDGIYKWLIRDQATDQFVTPELVGTYVQLAEAELNRELKIQDLEDTEEYTTSTTENFVTLPDEFRGIVSFEFDTRPYDIQFYPSRRSMKDALGNDAGRPCGYIIIGNKIIFNCIPSEQYEMTLDFYKTIPPLTEESPDNEILRKHPDVYLYGGIRQALLNLNNNERLSPIASVYQNSVERIKEDDRHANIPAGTTMRAKRGIVG